MQRLRNILFNVSLSLNVLVVIFLWFGSDSLAVPSWLQVVGRTHPLMLHFPIVLVVLYVLWELLYSRRPNAPVGEQTGLVLLLLCSASAAFTSLAGLLLAAEEGYTQSELDLHRYTGAGLALLVFGWYLLRQYGPAMMKSAGRGVSVAMLLLVTAAGHFGAEITHGEDYLFAPVEKKSEKPNVALEDALVFKDMVLPVLEAKCINCHNQSKAKGELVMETEALLLKGGKNGKLWEPGGTGISLLLERIHLPPDEKKHMPPAGKPQLTDEEAGVLEAWIRQGASFTQKVADLPDSNYLRQMAARWFADQSSQTFAFEAADESDIRALNSPNRVVTPLALESPALSATFYQPSLYSTQQLNELLKVKTQLVSLNLSHMPLTEKDAEIIGQMESLQTLNLSFTRLPAKSLATLARLPELRSLALSGLDVRKENLAWLPKLERLKKLYLWNSPVEAKELAAFLPKGVRVETGFNADTVIMQLTPPVLLNERMILTGAEPLQLKHYVNGTVIRYTLDGTEPDSLNSPEYKGDLPISGNVKVKAKAFKPGWISSNVLEADFFHNSLPPDTIILLTPPDASYAASGGKTLNDGEKADKNFKSGQWLGYRLNRMEALLQYKKPTTIKGISVSTFISIGSYIMPPARLELWAEESPGKWKLLSTVTPKQPTKMELDVLQGFALDFAPVTVSKLKLVGYNVTKLPPWHPGKGQPGWLFVDELFVN